ncbi:hypothetical protein MHYP_G00210110 [Metynnis hypsauchen]
MPLVKRTAGLILLFGLLFCSTGQTFNVTLKCMQDTAAFLMELEKDKPEEYAVQMYDAFGKLGSDVAGGNVNRAGSLQECVSVKGPSFKGQYCQVFLKQEAVEYFVGICVPDSCDEEEVRTLVVYEAFEQGHSSLIPPVPTLLISDPTLGIFMTQCISNITPDLSAVICLCVCVLMIAVPLVASIYVMVFRRRRQREVRPGVDSAILSKNNQYGALLANGSPNHSKECISLRDTTAARENNDEREQQDNTMSNRLCIKELFTRTDNDKRWRHAVQNSPLYVFAFSGPVYLAVDTFLLLGGLLSAKSLLTSIQRSENILSLRLVAHYLFKRFKRIQPLHLFIVCLIIALFSLLHRGVFWFMAEDEILNCKKYWWSNLLLVNNLFTITDICAPWTWYLSIDFQFYATTPLLIFLYRLNKYVLVAVAIILLVMSSLAGALITAFLHLPVHQPTTLAYESYFQYYYNKPYTRYGPYLLGVLAGLYMATKKEALLKQQWQAAAGWFVSLSIMALLVGLAYVLRDVPAQPSLAHAVYQGLHRSLWALAVVWIILACEEGYGGFVNKLLSLKVWIPLSNISFACYLIHPILILLYNGKQETPIHYTDLNFLYLFLGHVVLTIVLGFALTVLIEKPYLFLKRAKA